MMQQKPSSEKLWTTCNFFVLFFQITVLHCCSGLSSLWKLQLSGGGAKIAAAAHIWYQLTLNPAPGWKNARGAWDSQLIFRHNVCSAALEPQLLNFSCFSAFHQGSSIQCVSKKEFSTFSIFSSLFFGKCWNILLCFLWRNKEKYQWFYFCNAITFLTMDTSWSNMFSVRISGHNPFFSDLKFADLRKKPKRAKGSTASSSGDSGNGLEDSLGEDQSVLYKPKSQGKQF